MSNPAMDAYNQQKSKELISINQQMMAIEDSLTPTIPEDVFVNVFLPFFANIGNPYNINIDTWLGRVARSENKAVAVLDKAGNVLYHVPPMHDISVVVPNTEKGSVYSDVQYANQIAAISPADAEAHITGALLDKMSFRNIGVNGAANISAWVEIFKRYNITTQLPDDFVESNGKSTTSTVKPTVKEEELQVDGWEEF